MLDRHLWLRVAAASLVLSPLLASPGNVLLIIGDDVGQERVAAYGLYGDGAKTTHLDQLAKSGVLFRNCWSNPVCSSTRATIFTGDYGFRTKIGTYINPFADAHALALEERTIPEALALNSGGAVRTALLGKWHLGGVEDGYLHPNDSGFEHYAGSPNNLLEGQSYFEWTKVTDGFAQPRYGYATTDLVDDAIGLIASYGSEPWFVVASFHAPHTPLHAPPDHLHDYDLSGDPLEHPVTFQKAMIQAMDAEIGRMLDSIEPAVLAKTTVIFVGDNGTEGLATEYPLGPGRAKGSLYEGGIRVPLIVSGYGVTATPGSECAALVNTTDLFETVLELMGEQNEGFASSDLPGHSVSFVPYLSDPAQPSLRSFAFAEIFTPNYVSTRLSTRRAIRDSRYKLVRRKLIGQAQVDQLYDLELDPFERIDLLDSPQDVPLGAEEKAAYERLEQWLEELLAAG